MRSVVDALAFSGVWVALAAATLTAAAGAALGRPASDAVIVLAFAGTLAVYTLDRLRDVARDHATAPARTAFVVRHRAALTTAGLVAGAVAALAGLDAGRAAATVAVVVLVLGMLHRRLKRVLLLKPAYLTASWVAVTVGLPALSAAAPPAAARLAWVVAVVALPVLANAIASNVRDGEGTATVIGVTRALAVAQAAAWAGVVVGALAPPAVRPLAAVPLVTAVALAGFRHGERYGLVIIDGALVVGALAALAIRGHA
jgi:hypothetical protein